MLLNKKKFGIFVYNIISKFENWVKKGELRLEESKNETVCGTERL